MHAVSSGARAKHVTTTKPAVSYVLYVTASAPGLWHTLYGSPRGSVLLSVVLASYSSSFFFWHVEPRAFSLIF